MARPTPKRITTPDRTNAVLRAMQRHDQQQELNDPDKQRIMRRVEALRAVMQKVLRVMSASGVRLALAEPRTAILNGVPGWTNGEDVTINRSVISNLLEGLTYDNPRFGEVIAGFTGVCYHELGHILYSPRSTDRLGVAIRTLADQDSKYWWAYNALEDQRQENIFTGRYAPTTPYFDRVVSEWLIKTPEALVMSHTLVHGRHYLPDAIRDTSRGVFVGIFGPGLAADFMDVIDAYGALVFNGDLQVEREALEHIRRYKALLDATRKQLPKQPSEDNTPDYPSGASDDSDNAISKGKPSPEKQQEGQAGAERREQEKPEPQPWQDLDMDPTEDTEGADGEETDDDTDADGGDGDDADAEQEGQDDDADDGSGEDDGQEQDGDDPTDGDQPEGEPTGDTPTDQPGEDQPGEQDGEDDGTTPTGESTPTSGGVSNKGQPAPTPNDLFDAAQEVKDLIDQNPMIQNDIQSAIDAIAATVDADNGLGGMEVPFLKDEPTGAARTVVNKIMRDLQSLRMEQEPNKVRRQTAGRLNMKRFLEAEDDDMDLYDQWETEQEEAGGIEVVVLLDLSGSMMDRMSLISQMMWAMKTSFDRLDVRCTVLAFASTWGVLYSPTEKASKSTVRLYSVMGGTVPYYAIAEAHRLLMGSDLPNRVLVTITDGQWFPTTLEPLVSNAHLIRNDVVDGEIKVFMDDLHHAGTSSLLIGIYDADAPTYKLQMPVAQYGNHLHELAFDTCELESIPTAISALVRKILAKANTAHRSD
jgi:Mg-chelatase subunit ChlD